MGSKTRRTDKRVVGKEIGAVRKQWRDRISVALVYPNRYFVGMSNLGFQTVYRLLNSMDTVVCERVFLPEPDASPLQPLVSVESKRRVIDFDIVAFSISFENDYANLLSIFEKTGIPLLASERGTPLPLVMAGGVACFLNPEPIAPFIDCFLLGEAEGLLPEFIARYDEHCRGVVGPRGRCLEDLARSVPGLYAPSLYQPAYNTDGTTCRLEPVADVPETIRRIYVPDLSTMPTCTAIMTSDTTFADTYLIEVSRGCPHGCRFCTAGFVYRPPRFRPLALLEKSMAQGLAVADKIGLVGTAVSDLPWIRELCRTYAGQSQISFSSLRADAMAPELVATLRQSGVKTATIAPEAGSQRMRDVINKGITEDDILDAAEVLVAGGIPNIKLYFMIGLPTETTADVQAIVTLCKQIKGRFLQSSRTRRHIGQITLSLNCFVPKAVTPFQWAPMDDIITLTKKIKLIKSGLKRVANVSINTDMPRRAYVQALLSRGDRKVAHILQTSHGYHGNWPQTFKTSSLDTDFYVRRQRSMDEFFPWDFIDSGVKKSFLQKEYKRALQEKPSSPCPMQSCAACGVCDGS